MEIEKIKDIYNYIDYNSKVVLTFFFICLIFRLLDRIFQGEVTTFLGSKRCSIFNPLLYIRMVSRIFVHLDWSHFSSNFFYILLLGPMLEEKYGSINLIYMILGTAIFTSLITLLFEPKSNGIGCSDICYMMIVLCSIVNITNGKIPLTLILVFFKFIADEIILIFNHKKDDNVGHLAHVSGALAGFIIGYFIF